MDIVDKTIEAILYPHKTEKKVMNWIKYIFETGGGIVWVLAYWSLYLIPLHFLVDNYTPQSIFIWAALGVLLTAGTLFHRLKWEPNREKELIEYSKNQRSDYEIVMKKFVDMISYLDHEQLPIEKQKAITDYKENAITFRKKYFPYSDDKK